MERQQVGLAVLAVVLLTAGQWVPRILPGSERTPTAAEARRIGWSPPSESMDLAEDIYVRINDERAARGLPPLAWHDGLAKIAGRWSEYMLAEGDYRHSDEAFRDHPEFLGTAENIAMGYRGSSDVHVGWMESEGHRHNILDEDYDAVGVGVVCRADGVLWATQVFGVLARPASTRSGADLGQEPVVRRDDGIDCRKPWGPFR